MIKSSCNQKRRLRLPKSNLTHTSSIRVKSLNGFTPFEISKKFVLRKPRGLLSQTGFTLVELMVSTILLTFIIGALIVVFNIGRDAYDSNEGILDMQRVINQSIDGMLIELRQSRAADIIISGGGASISFVVPISVDPLTNSSSIQYYVDVDNQFVREHPAGTVQVLAINVNSVNFNLNGNIIDIVIQAVIPFKAQDLNFTIRERISLRS